MGDFDRQRVERLQEAAQKAWDAEEAIAKAVGALWTTQSEYGHERLAPLHEQAKVLQASQAQIRRELLRLAGEAGGT